MDFMEKREPLLPGEGERASAARAEDRRGRHLFRPVAAVTEELAAAREARRSTETTLAEYRTALAAVAALPLCRRETEKVTAALQDALREAECRLERETARTEALEAERGDAVWYFGN